ncbi:MULTISPECIES: ATP-binding protein [Haloferacaceae]|uniref:histidine kinase n=1 Tax=Halorubrum glutamatedens TaxID=2707018 RepID=A0ABD5QPH8_9EURY|nr:PAS domain-containing sensor histidine kinase [Halobellus captivus]
MTGDLPPAFDELEESVLLLDSDGDPIDQNAAAAGFLGYSDERLEQCTLANLVPGRTAITADDIREALTRVEDEEPLSFEWQIRRADGEHRWVSATLSPAHFSDRPAGILVELSDLTEYKARGRRLQLLYRVLRHDLRNDMSVIQGYASNLERAIEADDLEEQIQVIRRTAEKVGGFSESVAYLERLIEEDATERRRVDATELVSEAMETVRQKYPEATIETGLEDDLWLSADEGLKLAVEHTVDNAIRHNGSSEARVTVRTSPDPSGTYVHVHVLDDGPGIPEMELNALEGGISSVDHGQGLGLWLIKRCTESLGGSVSIEERDSGGTRVTLEIPRLDPV